MKIYLEVGILRRSVALLLLWMLVSTGVANGQPIARVERPEATMLQHGDLIWPRNPKAIVLYDSGLEGTRDEMKRQWESERDAFVRQVRANADASLQQRQIATNMEALSYEEFTLRYLAGQQRADIEQFGAFDDLFSVGHVGIVEVDTDGTRYVIEAVWGKVGKVQRVSYTDWLKDRAGSWVWVGRLDNLNPEQLSSFVAKAKSYLGAPYNFWVFDLADESGFYCSKLVWLSLMKSLNIALDDNPKSLRGFWFSPKQAWTSRWITRVNSPRDYTY